MGVEVEIRLELMMRINIVVAEFGEELIESLCPFDVLCVESAGIGCPRPSAESQKRVDIAILAVLGGSQG